MKKIHKEYLIIPIANIESKDNNISIDNIINSNNVIMNHQKIVLKLSLSNENHTGDAYELITNEPFYFKQSLFDVLYKGKPIFTDIESNQFLINIHPNFVTIEEVKAFFDEIISLGEAAAYKDLISDLLLKREELTKKRSMN